MYRICPKTFTIEWTYQSHILYYLLKCIKSQLINSCPRPDAPSSRHPDHFIPLVQPDPNQFSTFAPMKSTLIGSVEDLKGVYALPEAHIDATWPVIGSNDSAIETLVEVGEELATARAAVRTAFHVDALG